MGMCVYNSTAQVTDSSELSTCGSQRYYTRVCDTVCYAALLHYINQCPIKSHSLNMIQRPAFNRSLRLLLRAGMATFDRDIFPSELFVPRRRSTLVVESVASSARLLSMSATS